MTLRELHYLLAVADRGHFGRAAAACHVSQPTLSTQLRKLEGYLGAVLVERGGKGARLTPAGERVAAHARRIVEEAQALLAYCRSGAQPLSGALRIGIIPTLSPYLLPHLLALLKRECPRLELVVNEDLTDNLLDKLQRHEIDLALLALPVAADFETAPVFDEPFFLACPRNHPLAQLSRVPAQRLRHERMLLLTDGHCLRGQALAVCGQQEPAEPHLGDFRATSLETLCQLVASGIGCTLLPALATHQPSAAEFGFAVRPLDAPDASRRIGLAWRRRSPRAEEFRHLAKLIEANAPADTRPVGLGRETVVTPIRKAVEARARQGRVKARAS